MQLRHPAAVRDRDQPPAAAACPDGQTRPVDLSDGTLTCPDDVGEQLAATWADRRGGVPSDYIVERDHPGGGVTDASAGGESDADICTETLDRGGTCGRERPCQYHE